MAGKNRKRFSLLIYGSSVFALHVAGALCLFLSVGDNPKLLGLGLLAYVFGLRHAFDADHIAAIDNTVRKLIQQKQDPLGVGFFFSLGHSTVVFLLAVGTAFAAEWAAESASLLRHVGDIVGTGISGVFLIIIGVLNLAILVDIYRVFAEMKQKEYDQNQIEELLMTRGFMARYLKPLFGFVNRSWHVYPIGFVFGLGFDTLTEIALLGLTAGIAKSGIGLWGIVSLPLLFTAGMSLMDTTDGVFMTTAYDWAFSNPVRKIFYNLTVTSLSVIVALFIGIIELVQVLSPELGLNGGIWKWLQTWDFGSMGYVVVGLFVLTWAISFGIWKFGKVEERFSAGGRERMDHF
jgi:high-affinity nickel-transport protein